MLGKELMKPTPFSTVAAQSAAGSVMSGIGRAPFLKRPGQCLPRLGRIPRPLLLYVLPEQPIPPDAMKPPGKNCGPENRHANGNHLGRNPAPDCGAVLIPKEHGIGQDQKNAIRTG